MPSTTPSRNLKPDRLGDPTARRLGRISINPLRHIDPMGTVIIPLMLVLLSSAVGRGVIFGWAKPVPVDPRRFRQPLLDMALVALAGPVSNFVMASCWALSISLGKLLLTGSPMLLHLVRVGENGILVNLILFALNLFPIPPLDGGRVVAGILPRSMALGFMRLEPFGMWVILALLFSGILGHILWPVVLRFQDIISFLFIF